MTASNFNQFLYLSDLSGFGNFELKGSSMSLIFTNCYEFPKKLGESRNFEKSYGLTYEVCFQDVKVVQRLL